MAEPLLRPGARVIADNVLHPGAPLLVHDVKDRYDLKANHGEPREFWWVLPCEKLVMLDLVGLGWYSFKLLRMLLVRLVKHAN